MTGFIGGVIAAILLLIATKWQRAAAVNEDGWKRLSPGLFAYFLIILSGIMASITGYVAIIGSSREDAAFQEMVATVLCLLFLASTLFFVWLCFLQKVDWKGGQIRIQSIRWLTKESRRRFSDIVRATGGSDSGQYKILFRDGTRLWLPTFSRGAKEFYAKIPKRAKVDE